MSASKKQMVETLKELRNQVNALAKLKIEEASKQIDSYVKIVEEEQKRRRR
jgi:hypothetical protein